MSGFELFRTRRSERKDLHINPCRIHVGYSFVANVAELFKELCGSSSEFQRLCFEFSSRAVEEAWTCVVFFKGYGSHVMTLEYTISRLVLDAHWKGCVPDAEARA